MGCKNSILKCHSHRQANLSKEEYNGEALSKNINPIIFAIAV
jgi:hypothetical protein